MIKDLDYYMGLSYKIEVTEDKGEGGFALHCPELPGCITCADSILQGFEMIADAKKCWFEACLEDGIPIPEPSSIKNSSRLSNSFASAQGNHAFNQVASRS